MLFFGTYTTAETSDEFSFCIRAYDEEGNALHVQSYDLGRHLEECATIEQEQIWIQRARLAEAFLELPIGEVSFSTEMDYWYRLFLWSKTIVMEGLFRPGLKKENDVYYAKWIIDRSSVATVEQLDEWVQEGVNLVPDIHLIKSFVENIVDSYVRFMINTKFSMKRSQLGKLLQFNPFYIHEDWIQKLCMEHYAPNEGRRWAGLYKAIRKWHGETEEVDSSGKFCVRLEPTRDPFQWQLRFYWLEPMGQLLTWNELDQLRPDFLRALTILTKKHPTLFRSYDHFPFYSILDMKQAHSFLQKVAPQLRREAVAVLAPQSMQRTPSNPYRIQMSLEASNQRDHAELGLESLLSFDFRISLGGKEITQADLERHVTEQLPFTQVNGEWVPIDQEAVKESVEWLNKYKEKQTLSARDVFYFYASNEDPGLSPVNVQNLKSEGWIEEMFTWLQSGIELEEYPVPDSFQGELRPYQVTGMSWLIQLRKWNIGACLADDMGLGKTIQFLAYMAYCRQQKILDKPVLLICPTSVLGNWQKEIERFTPDLSVMVHHGPQRATSESFRTEVEGVHLVLTTYSLVQRDHALLASLEWGGIALDEAQHIKNASTLQSKAIRSFSSQHNIALSGTPIENRLEELWSIFEFLNPGFLGNQTSFRRQFVQPIERHGEVERMESLKKLVRPFMLRRSKSDPNVIRDLPEKIESKEYCPLSTKQAYLYGNVVNELMDQEKKTQGFARKGLILTAIMRLKQICNHPALVDPELDAAHYSGKMQYLLDMTEYMVQDQDQILIFTQFAKMGHLLKRELEAKFEFEVPFLHGGVPSKKREDIIHKFQEESAPILILTLKAGGVGLNLTRANRVIHFDRWWNPAVENQATDRAFRIGQTRTVHVHKFICMGTIEEKIDLMIERKQKLTSDLIGVGEQWITELESGELQELLTLHHQLIVEI